MRSRPELLIEKSPANLFCRRLLDFNNFCLEAQVCSEGCHQARIRPIHIIEESWIVISVPCQIALPTRVILHPLRAELVFQHASSIVAHSVPIAPILSTAIRPTAVKAAIIESISVSPVSTVVLCFRWKHYSAQSGC